MNIQNPKLIKYILIAIVILGFVVRFYRLGENPPALNWDEASTGYNAYSILTTGADEYGTRFPASIRSFDDYKPPLYVYLTVPSVALFGLTPFAVRLPSALLGALSIPIMYVLTKELLRTSSKLVKHESFIGSVSYNALSNKKWIEVVALVSTLFLALSPWHLQFSRAAYEGNIGLFFFMLGLYLFLYAAREGKGFILSALFFSLTLYSYHSFRLVTPVFFVLMSLIMIKSVTKQKVQYGAMLLILFIASIPVLVSFLSPTGSGSRLSMVTIFTGHDVLAPSIEYIQFDHDNGIPFGEIIHNRRIVYGLAVAKGYLDHFDPRYLFIFGDGGRQHHAVDMGMLYLVDSIFILLGGIVLTYQFTRRRAILFILLLIAPIASAITTGTPHPVRSIAMVPVFHIAAAIGVVVCLVMSSTIRKKFISTALVSTIILLYGFNMTYYFHQYYVHTPIEYGDYWQAGHQELFEKLRSVEDQYDHIIVTYQYDQPYIFYLFYNKIDPSWYQGQWDITGTGVVDRTHRKIGKYEFRPIKWDQDSMLGNTLVVGAPSEIPETAEKIGEIFFPNGETAFIIAKT